MFKTNYYILLISFLFLSCNNKQEIIQDALYITNVTVIDSEQGAKENQTVVIKEDRILKIVAVDSFKIPDGELHIDGTGKYLMPGLWDAHVHFAYIEELAPRMFDLFLTSGITSVRDTGGATDVVIKWKKLADENPTTAPRVKIAGPLIDGVPTVYNGSGPRNPALGIGSATLEEIETLVEKLDKKGVDFLKAYEMLSPEQFYRVMELAKKKNLKVTGHIPLSMDAFSIAKAGMNSLEHLRNLDLSCVENPEEYLAERRKMLVDGANQPGMKLRTAIHKAQRIKAIKNQHPGKTEEVLQVLKQNNVWQIPTLVLNTVLTGNQVTRDDWRETFELLPDSIAGEWLAGSKRIANYPPNEDWTLQSNWSLEMTKKIHKKGVDIMAGTDTPIAYLTPGYSLHEELKILVDAGLTNQEALATATTKPAKYFEMEAELGLVKEGFLADLVLLDKNPLENIKHTRAISAVIRSGKYHSRTDLDALLDGLRKD